MQKLFEILWKGGNTENRSQLVKPNKGGPVGPGLRPDVGAVLCSWDQ